MLHFLSSSSFMTNPHLVCCPAPLRRLGAVILCTFPCLSWSTHTLTHRSKHMHTPLSPWALKMDLPSWELTWGEMATIQQNGDEQMVKNDLWLCFIPSVGEGKMPKDRFVIYFAQVNFPHPRIWLFWRGHLCTVTKESQFQNQTSAVLHQNHARLPSNYRAIRLMRRSICWCLHYINHGPTAPSTSKGDYKMSECLFVENSSLNCQKIWHAHLQKCSARVCLRIKMYKYLIFFSAASSQLQYVLIHG